MVARPPVMEDIPSPVPNRWRILAYGAGTDPPYTVANHVGASSTWPGAVNHVLPAEAWLDEIVVTGLLHLEDMGGHWYLGIGDCKFSLTVDGDRVRVLLYEGEVES